MALIRRTVIDILDRGLKKIIVNDKTIFEEVQKLLVNTKKIKVIFNFIEEIHIPSNVKTA